MLKNLFALFCLMATVSTANAIAPSYNFNFTNAGLTGNQTVAANSVLNNPAVSFQATSRASATAPWYMGPQVSAVNLVNLGYYGFNGSLPTTATGLDTVSAPVLMKFSSLIDISSISIVQDNSRYGIGFNNNMFFVDAAGRYLYVSPDMFSTSSYTLSPNLKNVAGIVLPFNNKYVTSIIINLVPEPEVYAMLVIGLGMLGFMSRRRKSA